LGDKSGGQKTAASSALTPARLVLNNLFLGYNSVNFLCSDQSNYISGAEIHVNGGQHV